MHTMKAFTAAALLSLCSGPAAFPQLPAVPAPIAAYIPASGSTPQVEIVKELSYKEHTLEDTYSYRDTERSFQWDKMTEWLNALETVQNGHVTWVTLQNYKNMNGIAPEVEEPQTDEYRSSTDQYGISRYQSIPLYDTTLEKPVRYGRDGALFMLLQDSADYVQACSVLYDGAWYVPKDYVEVLPVHRFSKVIFVDRTNQNIATLEKGDGNTWYVRSMNPATTGLHNPPYQQETPLGIYVIQEHKPKMYYLHDGSSQIAGFAPWASRFTRGGYIHGVPLNNPKATEKNYIEFTSTLGTTPRSHMCVRNATSHAKFVYDWATPLETLVIVIE
jgi:hypothetical protein